MSKHVPNPTSAFSFDTHVDRRGTGSVKWDMAEKLYGVPTETGLAMWTADTDYPTADCIIDAVRKACDLGIFGYYSGRDGYFGAIRWWMAERHGWQIEKEWILDAHGLGNALALCLDVWSAPNEPVAIFTPVYHEFFHKIQRAGRDVTEIPLVRDGDSYSIDFDAADALMTGRERLLLWCSPQNPIGRIWTAEELRQVAEFARRHDLILVSDEVHQDIIMPGHRFVPMATAAPESHDRLVVLTAASKTFGIAGQRIGNIIIPDSALRQNMKDRLSALNSDANMLGMIMVEAAYSPEGAAWVDAQNQHLDENRKVFDAAVNAIPGVRSTPLQATYLAWVDFSGTGMDHGELLQRIRGSAQIASGDGPTFGTGGTGFQRFTLATTRDRVIEAGKRLQRAFADLQ